MSAASFDQTWERDIYAQGRHLNRYPWDVVVSFLYRYRDPALDPGAIRIVEVGCGAGGNLWFAAREGHDVSGIDASTAAISYAKSRFDEEGLRGDLRVGDFSALPFPDGTFHLAVDRAAITYTPDVFARKAVDEVFRVLRPGGRFLFNCYSTRHTSREGAVLQSSGVHTEIRVGTLAGTGNVRFYDEIAISALFERWTVLSRQHLVAVEAIPAHAVHAEWRVVVEKPPV